MASVRSGTFVRVGATLWVVQALALPIEWLVIGLVTAPYSLIDNTLSDLGAVGCGMVQYPGSPVPVCSPAHVLFNVSLIVGAVMVGLGALLLRADLVRPPQARTALLGVVLLLLGQASGIATALVPIDVDMELHTLVSAPGFVLQPVALLLIGTAARRRGEAWGWPMTLIGAIGALIGAFFVLRLDPAGGGLLERLVLWPAVLVLAFAGVRILQRRTTSRAAAA